MKLTPLLVITTATVLICSGWVIGEDPQSPSTAYLEFRQLVMKGDADQSWVYLSQDTQKTIVELNDIMIEQTIGFLSIAHDPLTDRLCGAMLAEMHLTGDTNPTDITAWRSVLAEAGETGTEQYYQPGFCITGEVVEGDKATLIIENMGFKRSEKMVKEDGKWKVSFPYVVLLAQAGWQLDLANYLSKVHDIMAMNKGAGLNPSKMDVSVREVVKK